MDINIRQATINDLRTIQNLNRELFLEEYKTGHDSDLDINWPDSESGVTYYQKALSDTEKYVLVAETADKPVGYVICSSYPRYSYRKSKSGEVENMYIDPDFRKQGIGKQLINQALIWLKSQGMKRVYVSAYAKNEAGVGFYESLGFDLIDVGLETIL